MPADPRHRLIVALDVSSAKEAMSLVEDLDGIVSFYKLGWQLFMSGEWNTVFAELDGCEVFIDLKLPGDIENTIESTVKTMLRPNLKFVTLSNSMTLQGIHAALRGRGDATFPKFLMVPLYSSLDASDLSGITGSANPDVETFIAQRAAWALDSGCDGLIASGSAISTLRARFPETTIVSPGIRLAGATVDDHKRSTTPGDAIRQGADRLVVGRPITSPKTRADRRRVAEQVVAEMQSALTSTPVSLR
jgi:orotidine-5'-phosphate decarboxylase